MLHRLHEAEMVRMWKSWVWSQQGSRLAYKQTNIHTRHLNLLLNHFNILLCIVWQLLVISNVRYIGLPARKRDVLHLSTNAATLEPTLYSTHAQPLINEDTHLHTPKFCCVGREVVNLLALAPVWHTNFYFCKWIQDVQFGYAQSAWNKENKCKLQTINITYN